MLLLRFNRGKVSLVATIFFFSAYSLCRDKVSSITIDLSLVVKQYVFQGLSFYPF